MRHVVPALALLAALSPASAQMVADIASDQTGTGGVSFPAVLDGRLYFGADQGPSSGGPGLFSYDPATGALAFEADLDPTRDVAPQPTELTVLGDRLYFAAPSEGRAGVVWSFDPTTGQAMVADPDAPAARAEFLEVLDGKLYFAALDDANDEELYVHDPTTGETSLVADLRPGSESSGPADLTAFGGRLYFSATDPAAGRELFRHDPATGVTERLTDLAAGIGSSIPQRSFITQGRGRYAGLDGVLYFAADDGTAGVELWAYDTASGTASRAADIVSGSGSSEPEAFAVLDGEVYFTADDGVAGRELWAYDPDAGTARLAADIAAGAASSRPGGAGGSGFTDEGGGLLAADGRLYFSAATFADGFERELYVYDPASGTAARVEVDDEGLPTPTLPDSSSPRHLIALDGRVFFAASVGETGDDELYVYDPASGEAALAADVNRETIGSAPEEFVVAGGRTYFSAFSRRTGRELWAYDPARGVFLAADLVPGNGLNDSITNTSSNPTGLAALGDDVYFAAFTAATGTELFVYERSTEVARLAVDLDPGPGSGVSVAPGRRAVAAGGRVFFLGRGPSGPGIYAYDPTAGTAAVVSAPSSLPGPPSAVGDRVYFEGRTDTDAAVLYEYDAATSTLVVASDLDDLGGANRRLGGGGPFAVVGVGDALYAYAGSPLNAGTELQGAGLWRIDRATGDAREVTRVDASGGLRPSPLLTTFPNLAPNEALAAVGGLVFFRARPADRLFVGEELRAYDPEADVVVTVDVNPNTADGTDRPLGSDPDLFRVFGDRLYIAAGVFDKAAERDRFPTASEGVDVYAIDPAVALAPTNDDDGIERVFDVLPGAPLSEVLEGVLLGYAVVGGEVIVGGTASLATGTEVLGATLEAPTSGPTRPEPLAPTVALAPNPTAGTATVRMALGAPSARARVAVFDVLGRQVAVLHDGPLAAGEHAFRVDGARLGAGLYVVRLVVGEAVASGRLTVVR